MMHLRRRLSALLRRGHIDERCLAEIAGPADGVRVPTPSEEAHLSTCRRCRRLLNGYRRAASILDGPWADRPLHRGAEIPAGIDRVRLSRLSSVRPARGPAGRLVWITLGGAAVVIALVVAVTYFGLRSNGPRTAGQSDAGASLPGPLGTSVVATLPVGQWAGFEWAPDGGHLLVSDDSGSRVYDRFGKAVGAFGPGEGWLDAGHLIDGDGRVWALSDTFRPKTGDYPWYGSVLASGHGSAAIIVAQPACVGDPLVDWYRDGRYVRASEKTTPLGWSSDGRLVLKGHLDCDTNDAEVHGWKGRVDVVDFASGRILATAADVRGQMALNSDGTWFAAQSDADLEFGPVPGEGPSTVEDARLLGWRDNDELYVWRGGQVLLLEVAGATMAPVPGDEWQIPSAAGPRLVCDGAGRARRIVAADGTTMLLDLSSTTLVLRKDYDSARTSTSMQPHWWSPDGRMLALESADGTAVVLLSVDPGKVGAVGTALPTPIASSLNPLTEFDRTGLPGRVDQLVSDTERGALWFAYGLSDGPIDLYRYDIAAGALSKRTLAGTTYDRLRVRLALAPDGKLWVGGGQSIVVYDPATDATTSVEFEASDPDVQTDPVAGKRDPWVAAIAFDQDGNALVARNWVSSVARVNPSLQLKGRLDMVAGFPMTGDMVVAGGRVFLAVTPDNGGLVMGMTATGTGSLFKFVGSELAAAGGRVLVAGEPPSWADADGGGEAMIQPVMQAADLVAGSPDGRAALYSNRLGQVQWRDSGGHVAGQALMTPGSSTLIAAIALDSNGSLWAVVAAGSSWSLVRLEPAR
jgi:hypothetical protein